MRTEEKRITQRRRDRRVKRRGGDTDEAEKQRDSGRGDPAEGEAGERVAFGDDGNRASRADESPRETAWGTGDALCGYGCGAGRAPALEQLCGHGVSGLHRFPKSGEPRRNCNLEVAGEPRLPYVDGSRRGGVFGKYAHGGDRKSTRLNSSHITIS